uniref:Prenylcysteine oxidase 1-like n=1 Tax=Saccoglossus kowalevskii TaxID=10224 RepID=A0ABM0M3H1_SACKO|nr:PREDICTED: prenylcysteine oxidase 1-like [Saccoglossus kowalevskii]
MYNAHAKSVQPEPSIRIGIIGGGIGGSSCSYFLHELFGAKASIDVYEPSDIGGRIATVDIGGHTYESGASIIHPGNMYMKKFTKEFGLKHKDKIPGQKMGFYDGEKFVFLESDWVIATYAKMLWHYGWDLIKFRREIGVFVEKFSRIYDSQKKGVAYSSVEGIMNTIGGNEVVDYTKVPFLKALKDRGYKDVIIDEMMAIATRVNYGQSVNMSAFAGFVSVAGIQGGLFSVHGGNNQVCSQLLQKSRANIIKSTIKGVKLDTESATPGYYLTIAANENSNSTFHTSERYDIIVIATPLHEGKSNISFEGFPKKITNFPGRFHRTVATFVDGELNTASFGFKNMSGCPNQILTTKDNQFKINSIAHNLPIDCKVGNKESQKPVWKVFSKEPLSEKQLYALFASRKEMKVVDWLAYPHYDPQNSLPKFELHDQLYYINGIEWAASAIEMLIVGSRNTALLAYNKYNGLNDMIDVDFNQKTEL